MIDYYDGFTKEDLNNFVTDIEEINRRIADPATAEEAKESKERFYLEIESIKMGEIEKAIRDAEESNDNERKTLLERVKSEVENARSQMYKRKAPDIINTLVGLNERRYSYNEYEYWDEAKIEDLIFAEQAIDEIKIDKNNFQNIAYRTNTDFIERAIKIAEQAGDDEKKERLQNIKNKIDKLQSSAAIYGYRYQPGKENNVERRSDESILSVIDRMFEELEQEASAGFLLNGEIYVFLTNAKDKNDFLKRLEVVSSKLEEYEKIKSPESIEYIKKAIEISKEDFETGDIQGMDKEVEGR